MADSLDHLDKTAGADLDYVKTELDKFKKLDRQAKEKKYFALRNKLTSIKKMLQTYEIDLTIASNKDADVYQPKYDQRCRELKELELKLNRLKDEAEKDEFMGEIGVGHSDRDTQKTAKPIEEMNKQELFIHGDVKLREADERLDDITKTLKDAKNLQDEVDKELVRIEGVLMQTMESAKDTQSLLKRSRQLINYFYRQLQTDKIIWCCLIVVVLLVLIVIILSFAGVKSDSFNNKALPNQNR